MNPQRDKKDNPWNRNKQNNTNIKKGEQKFKQAQQKLEEAVKKYANECESSEEEEELEKDNIIITVLKQYSQSGTNADIGRTQNFLQDAFQSGTCTCLICISSIKRSESIWTCNECYCFFHLMCIQRWSKDTITQQKQAFEAQVQTRRITMKWGCPKCRMEYAPDDIPKDYYCFCKRTINPGFQALIVPHSCGDTCNKELKPSCGHKCLLLCHPGPCPPCPQTVTAKCYCGAAPMKLQRCTKKEWSCREQCNKLLSCGKHKCIDTCHAKECQPCCKKSMQKCLCGTGLKLRDCATPIWQCDKVCNKKLSCGHHKCEEVCHPGDCGVCPRSMKRTCPCGKAAHELPCTEEVPTCGDTCNKSLDCEMHVCNLRCHKGKCQTCLETVNKYCRCGQHSKEVQCGKPYLCETKCKQIRDCNKHPCNRKCCDGNCPPCEKPCGKTLSCKKHACNSICHQGPCYPCNQTENVYCFCGGTVITVPCGRKTRTKPPKCNINCKISPECHHKLRDIHKCHFGDCPPCRQICSKPYKTCTHHCLSKCHSSVLVKLQTPRAATPWEERGPLMEKRSLPCPPCPVPVSVTCVGGHETYDYPCHDARPQSCHQPCNRSLQCGNHTCALLCHTVEGAMDNVSAGSNCEDCSRGCEKKRTDGCNHRCPLACHPGDCPTCKHMLRITCHCGLTQPYVNCHEWAITKVKETLQSCGNQCPHNFPCGHRCKANCHSGECPNADQCKKRVKVFCDCKRIKKEHPCDVVRNGDVQVPCDETCKQKQLEDVENKRIIDLARLKEEEARNKKELEKYEKMFAKKKNRDKKITKEVPPGRSTWIYFVLGVCGALSAVIIYFIL